MFALRSRITDNQARLPAFDGRLEPGFMLPAPTIACFKGRFNRLLRATPVEG